MPQGSRPDRVADQIRAELASLLTRDVKDPGLGFVTITSVSLTADLQRARVHYSSLGDEQARRRTAQALARASSFLRRQIASHLRLRRAPELSFQFDDSLDKQERIEALLREIHATDAGGAAPEPDDTDE
jgi:ribosome-binding factor A